MQWVSGRAVVVNVVAVVVNIVAAVVVNVIVVVANVVAVVVIKAAKWQGRLLTHLI